MKNISAGTIARTLCLVLALTNQILSFFGIKALPIEDAQINELVSLLLTVTAALVNWWKNNSFTKAAVKGDEVMHGLKKNADS